MRNLASDRQRAAMAITTGATVVAVEEAAVDVGLGDFHESIGTFRFGHRHQRLHRKLGASTLGSV